MASHHHFDASGTSNAMFDELAERSLMSPLAGTKHTYVRLTTIVYCQIIIIIIIIIIIMNEFLNRTNPSVLESIVIIRVL